MATIDVRRFADADDAREHYLGAVDNAAEQALAALERPGLAAVHTAKAADAERGAGPWLAAECAATGDDADACAERILAARERWQQAAPNIEQARIAAKQAIRNTDDPREMHAALSRFTQSLEANHV